MFIDDCLLCTTPLKTTPSWSKLFTRFTPTLCPRCEQQFEPVQTSYDIQPELKVYCLYSYNDKMVDYLHRYKFMHDTLLAKAFREQLYYTLKNTTVVPIPMHPEKLKQRTFSHVELLLQEAGIRYEPLLVKASTDTQSTKTREERLQTPQIFELVQKPVNKIYTLFDDIVTTGMTLYHAKSLLLDAGAKQVNCVTLIKA